MQREMSIYTTPRMANYLIKSIKRMDYCSFFPWIITSVFFLLQIRLLHVAVMPDTDEGVYAQAGRLLWQGQLPHIDFPLYHMPLLPFLIGLGLQIFHNIYIIRVFFLFIHCFTAILLYKTFNKLESNTAAGCVALLFYFTFHELVHHDFRFLAIRQLANDFLILFLYAGIVHTDRKWSSPMQQIITILSGILFLPSIFCLASASIGLIFKTESLSAMTVIFRRYSVIGMTAIGMIILYFIMVPGSWQQVILAQISREGSSRLMRITGMLDAPFDYYFYAISVIGLFYSLFVRNLRSLGLSMLGIVCISLFLSSNFYPHYLSLAAPAFAFGIFCICLLIDRITSVLITQKYLATGAAIIVQLILLGFQLHISLPSLLKEWNTNNHQDYALFLQTLHHAPKPLLAMQPIFAVESDQQLLQDNQDAYMRSPVTIPFNRSSFFTMEQHACTILLDSGANGFFPSDIQEIWKRSYKTIAVSEWGTILVTQHANCTAVTFP
ncbi:MAG: hypothetical protein JWM56_129 [Candidatus Peribacteria bacterium]|nr:hypothetical protein [Candidatus Peribacteria bacterium]